MRDLRKLKTDIKSGMTGITSKQQLLDELQERELNDPDLPLREDVKINVLVRIS